MSNDELKIEVRVMQNDVENIKEDVKEIKALLNKMDSKFVLLGRFYWTERIVMGCALSILVGIAGLLLKSGVLNV